MSSRVKALRIDRAAVLRVVDGPGCRRRQKFSLRPLVIFGLCWGWCYGHAQSPLVEPLDAAASSSVPHTKSITGGGLERVNDLLI
jgi:hypothetical protein